MADNTYAELCVVKAAILAKVPKGLDLIQAAALPLVTTTGNQLMSATGIKAGPTVLVVGAVGNVGRSAVFTAKERGATVIAGVLKRQMDEAKTVGADHAVATDDDTAIANLPPLDAVADTVGGRTAEKLIAKVKPAGVYVSVVGAPQNAAKYPSVKVAPVFSKFDRKTLEFMAEAVRDGKLVIPISQKLPLREAAEAQAEAEKGGVGKILLVARHYFFCIGRDGYAEYAVASAQMVAAQPRSLTFVEAASVPVVAVTAYQVLFDYAQMKAGQAVLIHGAAGILARMRCNDFCEQMRTQKRDRK